MKKSLSFKTILEQIRIKSWLKNLFVLCPIVFSLEMFMVDKLIRAIMITLSFCLISSAIYVFNDICDVDKDRNHSLKKNRPIASGSISIKFAVGMLIVLSVLGFTTAFFANRVAAAVTFVYAGINVLYSKWLKNLVIIDCFCISAGFVLRVMAGGTIVTDGVSNWLFLTVVALSLFMAFGKRKGELKKYGTGETRDVLQNYDMNFLNGAVFTCAGLTIVFYSLWSISHESTLVYTVPIVLFIVIRYLFLVFAGRSDADPTSLILSDKIILVACGIYALIIFGLLYGTRIHEFF